MPPEPTGTPSGAGNPGRIARGHGRGCIGLVVNSSVTVAAANESASASTAGADAMSVASGDAVAGAPAVTATVTGAWMSRRTREARSEEHTSELQSLMRSSYAVFCLKKKKAHKRRKSRQLTCIGKAEMSKSIKHKNY